MSPSRNQVEIIQKLILRAANAGCKPYLSTYNTLIFPSPYPIESIPLSPQEASYIRLFLKRKDSK